MMKKRTIIAAALAASMLASCGIAKNNDAASGEITAAVSEFFDAFKTGGFETAAQYITDGTALDKFEDIFDLDDIITDGLGELTEYMSEETMDSIKNAAITAVTDKIEYKINKTSVSGDGSSATANVSVTLPDFEDIDISDEKLNGIMTGVFGFDINDQDKLIEYILSKTGMSAEELVAKLTEAGDEDAFMREIFATLEPEVIEMINRITQDGAVNVKTETESAKFKLEKQSDGAWKIIGIDD